MQILITEELRSQTGPEKNPGTEDNRKPLPHQVLQGRGGVSSALGPGNLAEAEAMENTQ